MFQTSHDVCQWVLLSTARLSSQAYDDGLGDKHGDEWWRTQEMPPMGGFSESDGLEMKLDESATSFSPSRSIVRQRRPIEIVVEELSLS